jgi:hypothetical protein
MSSSSSTVASGQRGSVHALALRQLLEIGADRLSAADALWLRGVIGWALQGEALSDADDARVSAIRARLARLCHSRQWGGGDAR